jgi:hypothetical protein
MGYDVYVTRRKVWSDTFGDEIGPEEWMALVDDAEELDAAPEVGSWTARSRAGTLIEWSDGSVAARDPEDDEVDLLLELAERLGAQVQGEDGEVYLAGGRVEEA